jgi:opacity protein-like surface antigen
MKLKQFTSAVVLLSAFALPAAASVYEGDSDQGYATSSSSTKSSPVKNNSANTSTTPSSISQPSSTANSSSQKSSGLDFGMGLGQFVVTAGLISSSLDSNYSAFTLATSGVERYTAGNDTLQGEVGLGYLLEVNQMFDMGIEFFYDFGENSTTETTTMFGHVKHKVKDVLGVRLLPGVNITEKTRLYLDIGWAYVNQEINIRDVVNNGSGGQATFSKTTKSNHTSAYRYGAGIQTELFENLDARLSYVVMDGGGNVKLKDDTGAFYVKAKPEIQNFAVNLAYNFQL